MTNFEWLLKEKEEAVKESIASGGISVSKDNKEEVFTCQSTRCKDCYFFNFVNCTEATRIWLDEEH